MANQKLTFLLDVVSGKATADLEKFSAKAQADAAKAEGGFKALGTSVKNNMDGIVAGATAAGGVAIAAFARNAIKSFQDTAISAGELSAETGLLVQDASRWQEVANDLGVSTDSVATAINKMNREAAAGELARVGITTKDVNQQFLQTLRYLAGIADANKRAAEGTKLLGKGWQALSPLVAKVGELDGRLADVSEHKIVTPEQLKQAQEMRDNADALRDSFEELSLTVGGNLVSALNDLAGVGIPVVTTLSNIRNTLVDLPGPLGGFFEGFSRGGLAGVAFEGVTALGHGLGILGDKTDEAAASGRSMASSWNMLIDAVETGADATKLQADALKELAAAEKDATKALEDMVEAQGNLTQDTLDVRSARRDLAQATDDLTAAQRGAVEVQKAEKASLNDLADAQQRVADAQQNIVDARERLTQSQHDDARNVERAQLALANAKRDMNDAGNSNTANGFQDAKDRVRLAQLDLDAAMEHQRDNVRDGAQAVKEAEADKAKAVQDATAKRLENEQKLADAKAKSADATKSEAERLRDIEAAVDAQTAAVERLRQAEEKLRTDRLKAAGNPTGALSPQLAASLASSPPELGQFSASTTFNIFEATNARAVAQEVDRMLGRSLNAGGTWGTVVSGVVRAANAQAQRVAV